jgi:hypothetical protein
VTRQPAISFPFSIHFLFNRAGGRTSNVRRKNNMNPKLTMIQHIKEVGIHAWPHSLTFITLIIFSGAVLTRKLDFRYRISTLPLAFIPFFVGISGFIYSFSNDVNQDARFANFYELRSPAIDFHTYSIIPIMAAIETAILLIVSSILIITSRYTPDQCEQAATSNGDKPSN